MADGRFYTTSTSYTCPICGRSLYWEKRHDCDSLILVHETGPKALGKRDCENSGKKFYAPVHTLTEFKEDNGG